MGALSRATVRPAGEDDLPALHALVERAYRGESARAGWTHEADLLGGARLGDGDLARRLADPSTTLLVAEDGDAVVGCVELVMKSDGLAYLGLLSVDPDRQAGGLGRALLAAAEQEGRARRATRIEMTVIGTRHELVAYYERRGYRRTGERRPFDHPAELIGDVTTADLTFTVLEKPLA